MDFIPLQRPVVRIDTGEAHLVAQVVLARAAQKTRVARHAGLDGDPVAGREPRDPVAAPDDHAGALVAEDGVAGDDERADAARLPEVHVGAADARRLDVHEDLAPAGRVDGGLDGFEVVVCRDLERRVGEWCLEDLVVRVRAGVCCHGVCDSPLVYFVLGLSCQSWCR